MQDENITPKKKIKFTTIMVTVVFLQIFIFTGICIWLFCKYGHTPDTLIISVFGILGSELGICGFVTNSGNRYDYLNNSIPSQGGGVG